MSKDHVKTKKFNRILATAHDLFWKHGFRRVSIKEVCNKAGVSKMTFYKYFPNKTVLAKSVFDQVVDEGRSKFKKILLEETSASEMIRKMILLKMEGTANISKEFLQDFYANNELGLKEYVEEKSRQSWEEILADFRQAQEKGLFRRDLKPEFLFLLSQKIGDVIVDEKFLSLYDTPQELILALTNFFSYGISAKELR